VTSTAVPPVEIISISIDASVFAKSTIPDLLETLISARLTSVIFFLSFMFNGFAKKDSLCLVALTLYEYAMFRGCISIPGLH